MNCEHTVLYVDSITTETVSLSCLKCKAPFSMTPDEFEREWMAFESTEAPSWDARLRHADKDAICIRRTLFNG